MLKNPSLTTRIIIGKSIGLIIGLIGFFSLKMMVTDAPLMFRFAFLFWYITFGAIIGVFGVVTSCPISKVALPWWVRSSLVGAWLNFVLTLFIYDQLAHMMITIFGMDGFLLSPFWLISEGVMVALIIDYFATRFGGEGKKIID